jgi:hypothetical protein
MWLGEIPLSWALRLGFEQVDELRRDVRAATR